MKKSKKSQSKSLVFVVIAIGLVLVAALFVLSVDPASAPMSDQSNSTPKPAQAQPEATQSVSKPGKYVSFEDYNTNKAAHSSQKKVLFFAASWCPTCRQLDSDINSKLSSIPSDVSIIKVNYDDSIALKKQHGVTYQHTLVLVDNEGNQIKKWHQSPSLESLLKDLNS